MRRAQLSFGDGLIAEEVSDLRDHRGLIPLRQLTLAV